MERLWPWFAAKDENGPERAYYSGGFSFPRALWRGRKEGQRTGRPVGGSRGRICFISQTELPAMFNPVEVLIDAFGEQLRAGYRRMYGGLKPDYEDIICWASSLC